MDTFEVFVVFSRIFGFSSSSSSPCSLTINLCIDLSGGGVGDGIEWTIASPDVIVLRGIGSGDAVAPLS